MLYQVARQSSSKSATPWIPARELLRIVEQFPMDPGFANDLAELRDATIAREELEPADGRSQPYPQSGERD